MPETIPVAHIQNHIAQFFQGHAIHSEQYTAGPMATSYPDFRVLSVGPGPRIPLWTYVTAGACQIRLEGSGRIEFSICSQHQNPRLTELLTMTAWYHHSFGLGRQHILPIGEPWLPGSMCDHLLISLPYPFGPEFEICNYENQHVHMLWITPITNAERDLAIENDVEALEQLFDQAQLKFWSPERSSVV